MCTAVGWAKTLKAGPAVGGAGLQLITAAHHCMQCDVKTRRTVTRLTSGAGRFLWNRVWSLVRVWELSERRNTRDCDNWVPSLGCDGGGRGKIRLHQTEALQRECSARPCLVTLQAASRYKGWKQHGESHCHGLSHEAIIPMLPYVFMVSWWCMMTW